MSGKWYVHDGASESGPFSQSQLVSMSKDGTLLKSYKVRSEASGEWVKATKVRGLTFSGQNPGEKLAVAYQVEARKIATAICEESSQNRKIAVDFLKLNLSLIHI